MARKLRPAPWEPEDAGPALLRLVQEVAPDLSERPLTDPQRRAIVERWCEIALLGPASEAIPAAELLWRMDTYEQTRRSAPGYP
jgi:hypothetical protein